MPSRPTPFLDTGGLPVAFAHRGGARTPGLEGLENSRTAFRHAVDLGYTHLETDVHVTADGVLLAFHDDVLDRVTDRTGAVTTLSYDEVREARIGGREPIPRFADLLEELPGTRFNVDLKSDGAGAALADLLDELKAWDRVLVGSFSPRRTRRFRRRTRGRVATAAHPLEVLAYRALPSARLARLLTRDRPAALQVPERRGPLRIVTPGLLRRAHAAGVAVHVWTVDKPAAMHALLDLGVDGLMTDRTDLLREVLLARGAWPAARARP